MKKCANTIAAMLALAALLWCIDRAVMREPSPEVQRAHSAARGR